jgi:subtilisin family serine protease
VTVNSSRGTVSWVGSDQSTMTIGKPDITAPGTFITSTVGTGYGVYSGSSMAAPHVTATVALIKQAHPDMGPQAIRAALTAGAIDRGVPGPDLDYGAGALDAAGALAAAGADPLAGPAPATPVNAAASEPPTLRVLRVTRRGGSLVIQGRVSAPVRLRAQIRRSVKVLNSTAVTATAVSRRAGRFVLRLPARSLTRGRYVVVVTASNAAGKRLVSVSRAVRLT